MSNAFFASDNQQQASDLELVDKYAGGIKGRKRGLLNLPFALFENILNLIYGIRPCFFLHAKRRTEVLSEPLFFSY
ncbi:hypothetical protein [Chitinophaga pinensis]|uniref:Uncharacterized protein n=1 Tax=Chitinophaga pinensis TaxID=79329 RepID=A0A5C6LQE9_9BACT|nr:hypothetical protein [Chitinophaga pinensis]TWV98863.1 hypothetical protein FEF09_19195 [Chitinophaga pinensis]